jgi:hypothetical protein
LRSISGEQMNLPMTQYATNARSPVLRGETRRL